MNLWSIGLNRLQKMCLSINKTQKIILPFTRKICKRIVLSLLLSYIGMNVYSAVYITEISTNESDSYIELFNSSDTIVSLKGWKIKCGTNEYIFEDLTLKGESVKVIDLEASFFEKNSIVNIYNTNQKVVDQVAFCQDDFDFILENKSYQRDSVAILYGMIVKVDESPFKLKDKSKGYVKHIIETDRSSMVFTTESDMDMNFRGTSPIKQITRINNKNNTEERERLTLNKYELIVTPNPCTTILSIQYTKPQKSKYQLIDVFGRIVKEGYFERGKDIDMTNNESGIYFLSIDNETIKVEKK